MSEQFDAVILGMGPAGEVAASRLLAQGLRVAIIERELIGGECAYWACIPSKTLLRPTEARAEARRAAGVGEPEQDWEELAAYRDYMIRALDDSQQVDGYQQQGATVVKGEARIAGAGRVAVGDRVLVTDRIVIATGSDPRVPAIDGLAEAGFWTNREATTVSTLPSSVVIVGGGPVGIELGQFFARSGAEVTLLQAPDRLIPREDPEISGLILGALREDGIDVRLGALARSARREDGRRIVTLADGSEVAGEELLIATGREARVHDLGLETIGVEPTDRGITIDERCRVTDGVWAIGDATGVMPFTHVGMYQGRIAAADIAGRDVHADYAAIPRVVFSDPEIAAVGLTAEAADERGIETATAQISLADAIARPWTYERDPRGHLGLIADRHRRILVGAWAIAPMAGEWIHYAALAIKAQIPLDVLTDTVAQFPTYTEAYLKAIERLAGEG
jgi:dihydrolipoamide dehydrogenase